jgi:hypothetical protein
VQAKDACKRRRRLATVHAWNKTRREAPGTGLQLSDERRSCATLKAPHAQGCSECCVSAHMTCQFIAIFCRLFKYGLFPAVIVAGLRMSSGASPLKQALRIGF